MAGVNSVEALCAAAIRQGASALALTDVNGLYGAIRFIQAARDVGLRPLLGAELTHCSHRTVALARTAAGYANLCTILSDLHCDPSFDFIAAVQRHRDGLILLSDDETALIEWRQNSSDDLYVEVTPGLSMQAFSRLAADLALPPVATNRVHFIDPDEFVTHRLLRAIALNSTLSRLSESDCCGASHWMKPASEMAPQFPHLPLAMENAGRIAGQCHADWTFASTVFPAFRELSDHEATAAVRTRTYEGALWRYGAISPEVKERIEHELAIIEGKRFAHIFLVVEDIVQRSPMTCGRGSAAASIVAYCLGLTHVDPIRHKLYFERFLNPGRDDPPDIDIDFPWDERDGLLAWALDHYRGRAAMVANHSTLGLRGAVREVAKVYGMPPSEIDRVAPHVGRQAEILERAEQSVARTWAESLSGTLRLGPPWPEILAQSASVLGHFRQTAVHCGGLVIVPSDIRQYVPVEIAVKGVPVIQWEKEQTETSGLVKIDLLGNRSLSVIRDALKAVQENTGRAIDYATWDPVTDESTCELIRRGDTLGCFYVESPATRLLLKKLWTRMPADRRRQADVFEYLVIVSSLVRPAAISFVNELVRRAHGASYEPLHTILLDVLADTYGIMVYQEDVTRVAMALAGFSIDEADELRKVVSKKQKHRKLRDFCDRFTRGALTRGIPPATIEAVWAMIMSFAGYSFCKPHSASYAQVSFKSAYLRAHYPAEFMAAVITNQGGYYSTLAYLSEARRMRLEILPPDVNASAVGYTGNGRSIRVGLMQVKDLTESLIRRIVEEHKEGGLYGSFEDFLRRVKPEPVQARNLVKAGCCDSLAGGLSRPALLWRVFAAARDAWDAEVPAPADYSAATKAQHEIEILGFPLRSHPLEVYARRMEKTGYILAKDMRQWAGREVTMLGWLVTEKLTHTRRGEPMAFVTFEDTSDIYETTFFPAAFRLYAMLLAPNFPYLLRGTVEEEFGAVTLTIRNLQRLKEDPERVRSSA